MLDKSGQGQIMPRLNHFLVI